MADFVDAGAGRALVFLHGITCDKSHWAPVASLLEPSFRCVRIDLPGHGESELPPADLFGQVDAVHSLIDRLGLDSPILVGHSAGGVTSLVYGMLHPVRGIVVVDQPLDVAEFGRWVVERRDAWDDPARLDAEFRAFVAEHFQPELVPAERRHLLDEHVRPSQAILQTMWAPMLDDLAGAAAQMEQALPAVKPPVLLLYAHEPTPEERRLADLIPSATLETVAGVGHFMMLVDPPQVAQRIRTFADSL